MVLRDTLSYWILELMDTISSREIYRSYSGVKRCSYSNDWLAHDWLADNGWFVNDEYQVTVNDLSPVIAIVL